ncbi:MAG: peptidoglycan DD-metalloendopeptidase family protein [Lachnospiraceae bacterium]
MKSGKFRKLIKDKVFLTVMLLCLVLLTTVAAAAVINNQNKGENDNQYLDLESPTNEVADETKTEPQENVADANESANQPAGNDVGEQALVDADETGDASQVSGSDADLAANASEESDPGEAVNGTVLSLDLNFNAESKMQWPVQGNLLREYSMDKTVYYATLEQYKVSPGIVIQAEVGTPVSVPFDAQVMSIGSNEEIGNYVVLSLGNEYRVILGQLKDINIAEGQFVTAATVIASVNDPTKYYSVEGANLYLELLNGEAPIDPLEFIQ